MAARQLARAVARQLAPPDAQGRQWVHLLPAGAIECRDGRRYRLEDGAAIVAGFRANDVDLPVDFEHASEASPRALNAVPAAGWIVDLAVRDNGVWGLIAWTDKAARMIRDREYRYISPAFLVAPATGHIVGLKGAGLVHHPAMRLTALASQEDTMDDDATPADFAARVARALDLAADATLDDVLDAIAALKKGDPSKFVPVDAVAELTRDRNALRDAVGAMRSDDKVETAMRAGYLTPAMRDWATALCASDPESFDAFLRTAAPPYAHLMRSSGLDGRPPARAATAGAATVGAAQEIATTLGIPQEKLA